MSAEIDTTNRFWVGWSPALGVVIARPVGGAGPIGAMSKDDALNLAAWLVAVADQEGRFEALLTAIRNT